MTSIRGAITVESNTRESILEASDELLREIINTNGLYKDEIVDIMFSATKDLNAVYPAAAARAMGIVEAGLFCVQEMDVPGSLPMCLRILLHADVSSAGKKQSDMRHVYLKGAEVLRPDLVKPVKSTKTKPAKFPLSIAIDGPSGAGKSTVAKEVAANLGFTYIDTGAMYRAVALHGINKNIDLHDEQSVSGTLSEISIDIKDGSLILNGANVTADLRTQKVAEGSSVVAQYSNVRQKLVALQRAIAQKADVVMDGRDIGSYVLPKAQVKIYLDAAIEERTRRRINELQLKGESAEYEVILNEIKDRDFRDSNRTHAPLKKADDALYLKSDDMSVAEISQAIIDEIKKVVA